MKKLFRNRVTLLMILASASASVPMVASAMARFAADDEEAKVRHMVYDDTDKLWRCLGDPTGCSFGQN